MDVKTILILLLVTDIVLCMAFLFLFLRIGRNIGRRILPVADDKYLSEFKKLLQDSQNDAACFFLKLDESLEKFKDLALHLERKEESLKRLVQDVHGQGDQCGIMSHAIYDMSREKRHDQIMRLLETGLTVEQIAGCTGLTIGEVMLIVDLEKKREIADL